ncbi:hypothetical protein V2G26_001102 [Clonostachys chloroleuca]
MCSLSASKRRLAIPFPRPKITEEAIFRRTCDALGFAFRGLDMAMKSSSSFDNMSLPVTRISDEYNTLFYTPVPPARLFVTMPYPIPRIPLRLARSSPRQGHPLDHDQG